MASEVATTVMHVYISSIGIGRVCKSAFNVRIQTSAAYHLAYNTVLNQSNSRFSASSEPFRATVPYVV